MIDLGTFGLSTAIAVWWCAVLVVRRRVGPLFFVAAFVVVVVRLFVPWGRDDPLEGYDENGMACTEPLDCGFVTVEFARTMSSVGHALVTLFVLMVLTVVLACLRRYRDSGTPAAEDSLSREP